MHLEFVVCGFAEMYWGESLHVGLPAHTLGCKLRLGQCCPQLNSGSVLQQRMKSASTFRAPALCKKRTLHQSSCDFCHRFSDCSCKSGGEIRNPGYAYFRDDKSVPSSEGQNVCSGRLSVKSDSRVLRDLTKELTQDSYDFVVLVHTMSREFSFDNLAEWTFFSDFPSRTM
jgi:hypothetical protein